MRQFKIRGAPVDSSDPEKRIKTKPGFHFAILGNGYETHVLVGVLSVSVFVSTGLLAANTIFG